MSLRKVHSTVSLRLGDHRISIDRGVAPLIRKLWERGYLTIWSCQDVGEANDDEFHRGWASVTFVDHESSIGFMTRVTRFEPGGKGLYNRITHEGCHGVRAWEYEALPMDRSYDDRSDGYAPDGQTDIDFQIRITFPVTDIPVILERLKA